MRTYKPHPRQPKPEMDKITLLLEKTLADKIRADAMSADLSTNKYVLSLLFKGTDNDNR